MSEPIIGNISTLMQTDMNPGLKRQKIKEDICKLLNQGLNKKDAIKMVGIGETTFYRWLKDESFKSKVEYAISWRIIKQSKYKLKLPNSDGRGGFNDNPQNINQNGRPQVTTLARLMEKTSQELGDVDDYTLKYTVGKKLYELAINNGDIHVMRIIFDATMGKVR